MDDCIFCKISRNEVSTQFVFKNDKVIAFLDRSPINPGHTLVVPRTHSKTINDISEEDLCETIKIVKKVSKAILKFSDGVNIHQNNNSAAGQVVNHLHFHVIPRLKNDRREMWKSYGISEALQKSALEKIKRNL